MQGQELKKQSADENNVEFYTKEVDVEKSSADSAQSIVFFGRESSMKIRVVLKQYSGKSFESIFKEIKIFTMLEAHKKSLNTKSLLSNVIANSRNHDGMPELLGYQILSGVGEILMTNGGDCLETWMEKLKLKSNRVGFMTEMLK